MLDQNKFQGLFRQYCCSALLRDCIYEFLILIARGAQDVWLDWADDGTHYFYKVHDYDELREFLNAFPIDKCSLTYRCGYGRESVNQQSLCFPFDDDTPLHVLSGFRDAMRSLPRYWHGGQACNN
jgi:hypothetical protein